ncbi:hypothetical protein GCM10011490_14930 [Pseudoclavibacter endophyticus]|uniref:DUF2142 domain-containing protein n=1 Tax=Pseudoclavibacter endophyticus TaxID=1778590 RepID=A0A6H9WM70_9MICO|nr:DUF2142 domain-containing protein [Pseudoclavibacter endophyticus]KAB1649118.1 DUF2142 domain-containing protein [Pseudoclavibacter endophyticus]GGA65272.1 hypothetical protein GCM10011490_14930 [Pseudoclavibacter endophyticus]
MFLIALAVVFGMHATWALLTPLGGSPDETAHIVKAAGVAHGQGYGEYVDGTQRRAFTIPTGIRAAVDKVECTALRSNAPAVCDTVTTGGPDGMITVNSTAGLYNPVFYVLVGWPALLGDGDAAVYGMRLLGALLNAIFVAAAIACLSLLPRSRILILAALGIMTPTVAFLGGMVNPNALEVSTVAAFSAALYVALTVRARGRLLWWLCGLMAIAGMLGLQVRSLSPLWFFVAVVLISVIAGWRACWELLRRRQTIAAIVLVATAGIAALASTLSSGTLAQLGDYEGQGTRWDVGLRVTLFTFFEQVPPMVGAFGWNDASIPDFAVVAYLVLVLALAATAILGTESPRGRIAVLLALAAVPILPAIVQGGSVTNSGYIWQGRYGLALVTVFVYVTAFVARPVFERLRRVMQDRLLAVTIGIVALAHATGLQILLHRYGSGIESEYSTLLFSPAWTPFGLPMLVPVLGVWIVAALWAIGAALLVQAGDREREVEMKTIDDSALDTGPSHAHADTVTP